MLGRNIRNLQRKRKAPTKTLLESAGKHAVTLPTEHNPLHPSFQNPIEPWSAPKCLPTNTNPFTMPQEQQDQAMEESGHALGLCSGKACIRQKKHNIPAKCIVFQKENISNVSTHLAKREIPSRPKATQWFNTEHKSKTAKPGR